MCLAGQAQYRRSRLTSNVRPRDRSRAVLQKNQRLSAWAVLLQAVRSARAANVENASSPALQRPAWARAQPSLVGEQLRASARGGRVVAPIAASWRTEKNRSPQVGLNTLAVITFARSAGSRPNPSVEARPNGIAPCPRSACGS